MSILLAAVIAVALCYAFRYSTLHEQRVMGHRPRFGTRPLRYARRQGDRLHRKVNRAMQGSKHAAAHGYYLKRKGV